MGRRLLLGPVPPAPRTPDRGLLLRRLALWVPIEKLFLSRDGLHPADDRRHGRFLRRRRPPARDPLRDPRRSVGAAVACSSSATSAPSPSVLVGGLSTNVATYFAARCCSASTSRCSPAPWTRSSTTPSLRRPAQRPVRGDPRPDPHARRAPLSSAPCRRRRLPRNTRPAGHVLHDAAVPRHVDALPAALPRAAALHETEVNCASARHHHLGGR